MADAFVDSRVATMQHIFEVSKHIDIFIRELIKRARAHDASKLEDPEKSIFDRYTACLAGMTYGSKEYKECMQEMAPAIKHHYENNDHHPEHHQDPMGNHLSKMDLFQIIELLCDWMSAVKRHNDGNIFRSIEINSGRFNISPQLTQILRNTAAKINDMEANGQ